MTSRDRAWRRRQTRVVEHRIEANKDWLGHQLTQTAGKAQAAEKHHQPGKLTHVQAMRQDGQLREDAQEGLFVEPPIPLPLPPT